MIAVPLNNLREATPALPSFRRINVKELSSVPGIEKADTDGDGFIDINELVAVITKQQETRSTNKILKYLVLGLLLTLLITIGAVVGLTYYVVSTLKDTNVNSSNTNQAVLIAKSGGLPIATDQLLTRSSLQANFFSAPVDVLRKTELLSWDQSNGNVTLKASLKVNGFIRTNTELRFFTTAGEIVMKPDGSLSLEPPAWSEAGIQFHQAQALIASNTSNITASVGKRRSLLSAIRGSNHPLHNGLLTGFSVSNEAVNANPGGRNLLGAGTPADVFTSGINSVAGFVDCSVGTHSSDPMCYYCQGLTPWGGVTPAVGNAVVYGLEAAGNCKAKGYSSEMAGKVLKDDPCSPGMRVGGIFENPPEGCPGHEGCFPASASVLTPMGLKQMDAINLGDEVWVVSNQGHQSLAKVVGFGHQSATAIRSHSIIQTAGGHKITLLPSHWIFASKTKDWKSSSPIWARDVKAGMFVFQAKPNSIALPDEVLAVSMKQEVGLYAPITDSLASSLIVDGIVVHENSDNYSLMSHFAGKAALNVLFKSFHAFGYDSLYQEIHNRYHAFIDPAQNTRTPSHLAGYWKMLLLVTQAFYPAKAM